MEQKIISFLSANMMPISLLEWFVLKWKKAQTKNREETSRVAYYCYKHKRYRMTTAKRLRNVIQDLFRAKIDDNVQNQK